MKKIFLFFLFLTLVTIVPNALAGRVARLYPIESSSYQFSNIGVNLASISDSGASVYISVSLLNLSNQAATVKLKVNQLNIQLSVNSNTAYPAPWSTSDGSWFGLTADTTNHPIGGEHTIAANSAATFTFGASCRLDNSGACKYQPAVLDTSCLNTGHLIKSASITARATLEIEVVGANADKGALIAAAMLSPGICNAQNQVIQKGTAPFNGGRPF